MFFGMLLIFSLGRLAFMFLRLHLDTDLRPINVAFIHVGDCYLCFVFIAKSNKCIAMELEAFIHEDRSNSAKIGKYLANMIFCYISAEFLNDNRYKLLIRFGGGGI